MVDGRSRAELRLLGLDVLDGQVANERTADVHDRDLHAFREPFVERPADSGPLKVAHQIHQGLGLAGGERKVSGPCQSRPIVRGREADGAAAVQVAGGHGDNTIRVEVCQVERRAGRDSPRDLTGPLPGQVPRGLPFPPGSHAGRPVDEHDDRVPVRGGLARAPVGPSEEGGEQAHPCHAERQQDPAAQLTAVSLVAKDDPQEVQRSDLDLPRLLPKEQMDRDRHGHRKSGRQESRMDQA